jgi:hypothetical protein
VNVKLLVVLGLVVALIVGYVLWGVFFYAPLIGGGWTTVLIVFSALAILFGVLTTD